MENYTINELAMMTGLTTRTLRNYIKMDLLSGEKIDGVWRFTVEDISAFFCNKINKCVGKKIKFIFERNGKNTRIILSGYEDVVRKILDAYYER